MKKYFPENPNGFSFLELLITVMIITLGCTWAIPQYRRRLALNQLDQYTHKIESGLSNLRARQSAEGTSCEINFNQNFSGINNASSRFGSPSEVIEFSHLSPEQRDRRLRCCDATQCTWARPYRLIDQESTRVSKTVEVKVSEATYSLSPPGTSTGTKSLVFLVRSLHWDQDAQRPLPLRCVSMSTAGHLHQGTWEEKRCRRR